MQARDEVNGAHIPRILVAYRGTRSITWRGTTQSLAGRTLEESFALENLEWCRLQKDRDRFKR